MKTYQSKLAYAKRLIKEAKKYYATIYQKKIYQKEQD